MEQLGIDFNATGSVMSKAQLEEQRRKRGECLTCGRKCFQKKLFKMIPITDHGRVLNGRCLNCNPLEIEKGSSEVLPAVARAATHEDMGRFTSSRTPSGSQLSGPGVARRSSTSAQPPAGQPKAPTRAASAVVDRVTPQPAPGAPRRASSVVPGQRRPSPAHVSVSASRGEDTIDTSTRSAPTELQRSRSSSPSHGSARKQSRRKSRAEVDDSSPPDRSRKAQGKPKPVEDTKQNGNEFHYGGPSSVGSDHGDGRVLDRGGAVVFKGIGDVVASPPLATMKLESNRTLSSMSSIEEEGFGASGARGGRRSAVKHSAPTSNQKRAATPEEGESSDDAEHRSRSPQDKRTAFASKSGTAAQVSAESLMSGASLRSSNRQMEAEQRALQKIQRAHDDYKEIVRVMKKHPSSELIQQEAFKSLSNCHFSREDYVDLSKLHVAGAVVNGMVSHRRSSEVQVNGCRAVWNLSATSKSQLELMDNGALDAVLMAMDGFPDDAEVQEKAMAALSNLGAVEASQEAILQSGAIGRIVGAMNKHTDDSQVQMKGCAAITNLASHDSPLKRAIVEAGGGGAVVVSMVMHTDEVDLQEKALRALRNICANSEENKVEVANVGGIDAVISAMQVHRDEPAIQEAGAWTLSNLAQNSDNKATIGDSGGIDVIIRAMWVHSDNTGVQEWCVRALLSLSTDVQNRRAILEVGGISAMVNAMQGHTHSATVQEKSCGTLSNLAALDEDTKLRIVDEEALDAIVMAMVLHPEHRNVQDRACSVLRRLAISQNVKQMQAANVGELVQAAVRKFPDKCGDKGKYILAQL